MPRKLLVLAIAFALGLAAVEGATRVALRRDPAEREQLRRFRAFVADPLAVDPHYDPHPFLGYDLRRETPASHMGRSVPLERTAGVPRIACLGASTTQGGPGSWPGVLAELLERDTGGPVEVMNWGVAGWSSAETLVNYALRVQAWSPDIVLVHHAANDVRPRMQPGFRMDYAHYRHPWIEPSYGRLESLAIRCSDWYAWRRLEVRDELDVTQRVGFSMDEPDLTAQGWLLPETAAAFRRNVTSVCELVRADGGRCALLTLPFLSLEKSHLAGGILHAGIREHNAILRSVAREEGALLVDLEQWFAERPAATDRFFKDVVHLEKGGDRKKARVVANALLRAGWLEELGGR